MAVNFAEAMQALYLEPVHVWGHKPAQAVEMKASHDAEWWASLPTQWPSGGYARYQSALQRVTSNYTADRTGDVLESSSKWKL
jgi:hypothetical protein